MHQFLKLLLITLLISACSSENTSNKAQKEKSTIAGPFPTKVTGTVEHWEDASDGQGTTLVFLKEYSGSMLVLPADPDNPGRVEQAGTKVSFEVNIQSADKCGNSKMQCLLAR